MALCQPCWLHWGWEKLPDHLPAWMASRQSQVSPSPGISRGLDVSRHRATICSTGVPWRSTSGGEPARASLGWQQPQEPTGMPRLRSKVARRSPRWPTKSLRAGQKRCTTTGLQPKMLSDWSDRTTRLQPKMLSDRSDFCLCFRAFFFSCCISSKRLRPTAFLLWQQGHGCLQDTAFLHHQRTSKGKQPPEPPANPTSTANILEESLLNILEAGHRAPRLFWGQEMEAGQGAGSPDGGNWPQRGLRKRNESWQLGQGGETKPPVPTGETCFQSRVRCQPLQGNFSVGQGIATVL